MAAKLLTRQDYGRRIARAIALIAADPARAPGLDELAAAAAFSPFHFHRIYREITGETPAETVARERLSRAAALLARESLPIATVARRCGYGSAAAFTRAFRAAYGVPPAAYRDSGGIGQRLALPRPEETEMFDITIRTEPPLRLASVAHRGAYTGIGTAFDRLKAWARARGLEGPETRWIALYHDDPSSVAERDLRAEAGITVPEGVEASEGVTLQMLPATRLAVLTFRGPYAELERAYRWLYRDWLPSSGEEPADQPAREEYLNDCRGLPPSDWLTAVMLPLRPAP
ncbi:helix-turn-helix domain-containing protein [Roseomonas frigidaquae]|uniref:Helix-turn-helix domain-containing protein n=1 Tax=Falsiroseomonas frigidaquae TaxID=487318 RepID=A0ABX1EWQ9_9PROT|nr:GyrI-like domain-containing protein [Falsiroseomonas frigidaquae]NKE44507.1 helix-turn-helix domain-containing protein [Falsiroseomonas frigidaquae]